MTQHKRTNKTGAKLISGLILLGLGIVTLPTIYAMRPPQDLRDTIGAFLNNSNAYLQQPYYNMLMGLSIASLVLGAIITFVALRRGTR